MGYVVLESSHGPERRWIEAHPEAFELVAFHANRRLWRFTAAEAAPPAAVRGRRPAVDDR